MNTAIFRFHDEVNDFLPSSQKDLPIPLTFESHQTVKHLVESLGVPHTEVGRILVNGREEGYSYRPRHGDQIEIYPPNKEYDPSTQPHFVLDNHLGRLAAILRMLGFDTLYRNDYHDEELAEITAQEARILLTRDRRLLMRKVVLRGYCIRQDDPPQQAREVLQRFSLAGQGQPFQRCLRCNTPLRPVSKEAILERLEPKTRLYYDEFHICPNCDQIYWKGSHYEHMLTTIAALNTQTKAADPPRDIG